MNTTPSSSPSTMSVPVTKHDPNRALASADGSCSSSRRGALHYPATSASSRRSSRKKSATCTGSPGRSSPSTASSAAAPPSPWTRSSHAGRTPCSASPLAPGAGPYDPSPNSRRPIYSLRQWRDSHHLLFDREPARWTSQWAAVTRCQAHQGPRPRVLTRPRRSESNWRRRERLARHQSRDR